MALDRTIDTSFLDVLSTTIEFQSFVTGNNIRGWNDGCFNNGFPTAFSAAPVTVASMNTRAGGNGGWIRRCALGAATIGLTVDEDIDTDSERNHINETAGVVAASAAFHADIEVILSVTKTVLTIEDEFNGLIDPKAIPAARVEYSITTENNGIGSPDIDSLVVTDDIAADIALCVTAACNSGGPVVLDTAGSPVPPGVTLDPANVSYSNNGGSTYVYIPNPDTDGFDPLVDSVRVRLSGILAARTASGVPQFTLRLVSRVD